MLLYTHPQFLLHDTGPHPECAERLVAIHQMLAETGLAAQCQQPSWQPVSRETLARVHDLDYVDQVIHFAERGGGYLDGDTVVSDESPAAAFLAAGAVCDAVTKVVQGEARQAFALVRPPGHHALQHRAMGFCLWNHVAIGARLAIKELGLDRVMIVDWDVHHGNGTQDTFYEDEQVGFLSIHRWPFYPGSGTTDETGSGPGLGTTLNLPIAFGTRRADYLKRFTAGVCDLAARIRPQLLLVSAGFDAHRLDPIGSLSLESEDYVSLTQTLQQLASEYCQGKLVLTLEGGYHTHALAESVEHCLRTLLAAEGQTNVTLT